MVLLRTSEIVKQVASLMAELIEDVSSTALSVTMLNYSHARHKANCVRCLITLPGLRMQLLGDIILCVLVTTSMYSILSN